MTTEDFKRKLAAILSTDAQGYSRLMGEDEVQTVRTLKAYREVMTTLIQEHSGRVVDSPGDNVLAEFASVVDAVECAVEIQNELKTRNAELAENRRMEFRIGINLGDVIEDGERIYGDGVNIAARVEGLAKGGGICISGTAYDHVENKVHLGYEFLGEHSVKNIKKPVRVYRVLVLVEPEVAGKVIGEKKPRIRQWRWMALAAAMVVAVAAVALWYFAFRPSYPPVEPASVERMMFPLPEKPSIAVLPFENFTGDPHQEYLADGITENVITALSNISEMFVIARSSTFRYKGKPVKVQQVSEDLGVRYVLEGSVQKAGDRLRITAQLVDALTGHHLWAKRYDRDLKDVFAMQDEITLKIVTAMRVELTEGEQARLWRTPDNFEAWGYFVRAGSFFEHFTKEDNTTAREFLEQALEADPNYAFAWTMLAWTHLIDAWLGFRESRVESIKQAVELGEKALALDDSLPEVHSLWGTIHLVQRKWEEAVVEGKKAISLGPNNALSHLLLAYTMLFSGKFDEAIVLAERSIRLTPYCPDWYLSILAQAYRQTGRYEEALATYEKALERSRKNKGNPLSSTIGLVDVSFQLGREEEARAYAAEVLRITPNFSLESFRDIYFYKEPAHLERILVNLRRAGLPDKSPPPLPEKPSIAVLPFTNLSDDPEQEYFADGMTEDLITDLSKISGLLVIAHNSVFIYKGKAVKIAEVARELGVRYVLQGSVRKVNGRVRITAQLVDTTTGGHLWAERYDRDLKDIFAVQDEVTQKIVTSLAVKLTEDEHERLVRKYTDNMEAYDYYLRGLEYLNRSTKEADLQARQMFERAIDLDSEFAAAYAHLGHTHLHESAWGWSQDSESLDQAFELAQRAIALDDSGSEAHWLLGSVYLWKKQHEQAIAELEKSIALNPNYDHAIAGLGDILIFAGRPEEAIGLVKRAMRLNPIHPVQYLFSLGHAYFLTGQYEEAIATLRRALNRSPNFLPIHVYLAAIYIELGREEEAHAAAAEVLRLDPKFSVERFAKNLPYKDQTELERIFDAMREMGLT